MGGEAQYNLEKERNCIYLYATLKIKYKKKNFFCRRIKFPCIPVSKDKESLFLISQARSSCSLSIQILYNNDLSQRVIKE